ncbi:hypothetical protein EW026_g2451 [Hermanssonia centrifuga]|uniref:DUF6535 domain-containing protein n=1 Tax=Hermanssonia centrifuga TaxID=98765 RepID=A0A4S4KP91_9APHY|nr:hypothetical protein EW026_g2451 [Hermanssonia centrifuga]
MAEPDSTKPSPNAAQETGWAGIENHMREYDEGEMKVLNDDIDALLIFAGLFSAVLTAFVVPSYLLLQPDNSQLSVQILDRISAQLARFEILPPFINSTASDSSASPPFQVSTSARWMNCLWFLSLILSLSSALFRYSCQTVDSRISAMEKAWEGWKVSAGISTIPALLELAVVLFLAGLVVLVWTLDTVVAIVITTAVSVVIMVLCTVTVLPAVYRRCPYKSPTGWACVIMFDALARVVSWTRWHFRWLAKCIYILRNAPWFAMFVFHLNTVATKVHQWISEPAGDLAATFSAHIRRVLSDASESPPSFPQFSNWRERDLYVDDLGSSEISNINDIECPYSYKTVVAKDICEVMPLVRALSWVRKGTEDPRLLKHVATSAESLHTDDLDAFDRYYVFMYVLRKLCSAKSQSRELKHLSDLEGQLQSKAYKAAGKGHNMFRGGIYSGYDYLDLQVNLLDYSDLWVLGFLLLGDIMYMLDHSSNRLPLFACLSQHMSPVFRDNQDFDMGHNELHLAVQMFDQNAGYSDPFARHQFVMMADLVMRSLNECYFPDNDLMGTLLEKMSEAVTISLKEGYENCGCYHELPWIGSILTLRDSTHLMFDFSLDRLPAHPLWSLMEGLEKGLPAEEPNNQGWTLLTGENIRTDFFKLKGRVEMVHPRQRLAYGPMTDVDVPPSDSQALNLSGPLSLKGPANADVDSDNGDMQSGGNDGVDFESCSKAAHSSQHSGEFRIEGALQAVEFGGTSHTPSNESCRDVTGQTMGLEGLVDPEDSHVPSSPQHPLADLTLVGDRGDKVGQPQSSEMGLSDSFAISTGDDTRWTMPLSPTTDVQASDNVVHPDDPGHFPNSLLVRSSDSGPYAGRTITRNSSSSRDRDEEGSGLP